MLAASLCFLKDSSRPGGKSTGTANRMRAAGTLSLGQGQEHYPNPAVRGREVWPSFWKESHEETRIIRVDGCIMILTPKIASPLSWIQPKSHGTFPDICTVNETKSPNIWQPANSVVSLDLSGELQGGRHLRHPPKYALILVVSNRMHKSG